MKSYKFLCVAAAAMLLAGCAAPSANQYYTLAPEPASAPAPAPHGRLAYALSVQPVKIPAQVDRPQIVIGDSTRPAQLQPLNHSLWAAPLADEIRHALAGELSQRLGVPDIPLGTQPRGLPVWRLDFTVDRYELIYARAAVLEATWRLAELRGGTGHESVRVCRALAEVPARTGVAPLVAGQRLALQHIAALIAGQISGHGEAPATGVTLEGCT
ncbi:PqiC family protein [Candidimonas nitroreducens]|uniref:PqiC family protein n=1 Tax=Candidimonas nitroreducens TaxID=683354 RepID=UPI001303ABAA|nr:PqiC family protein [Candidimonas nitroreducens]